MFTEQNRGCRGCQGQLCFHGRMVDGGYLGIRAVAVVPVCVCLGACLHACMRVCVCSRLFACVWVSVCLCVF